MFRIESDKHEIINLFWWNNLPKTNYSYVNIRYRNDWISNKYSTTQKFDKISTFNMFWHFIRSYMYQTINQTYCPSPLHEFCQNYKIYNLNFVYYNPLSYLWFIYNELRQIHEKVITLLKWRLFCIYESILCILTVIYMTLKQKNMKRVHK